MILRGPPLTPTQHAANGGPTLLFLCVYLFALMWPQEGVAAAKLARSAAESADVATDLRLLAQQQPWICADEQGNRTPGGSWTDRPAQCAWQNRLRMRTWNGQGGLQPGSCVSAQAHWWAWARAATPAAASAPSAWRTAWSSQSIIDESGPHKRIVVIRRVDNGQWNVTEWRWSPSTRAATRRWQEGRWKQLAARAVQLRQAPEPEYGPPESRKLRAVLEANLGARVGEIGSHTWQWKADGLCLHVDAVGLGKPLMHLPYAIDDSRLEQRAAMQVQLARRYPKATWLSPFNLLPTPANGSRSGAQFHAMWLEGADLKGQLWIPTKGDGPLVRLRVTTVLPVAPDGQPDAPTLERARQVLQREIMALAARWTIQHD